MINWGGGGEGYAPEGIALNEQRYENAEVFTYLGFLVMNTNDVETDVKERIIAGNKYYHTVNVILKKCRPL
jgi:hypothetical protein